MSTAGRYQPIPSSDPDQNASSAIDPPTSAGEVEAEDDNVDIDINRPLRASTQREFNRQPPAIWKRVVLLLVILGMGYFSYRVARPGKDRIIYAQR